MNGRCTRLLVTLVALCACGTVQALRLATIGDFGDGSSNEGRVANMVNAWGVDDVLALGDCNYPYGENATLDPHVGAFYARYISPYKGTYGSGSANGNHFWPIPGNHDYGNTCGDNKAGCTCTGNPSILQSYLWYMPTQGRAYYNQVLGGGLVEVFAVDSDCNQVDGTSSTSVQANWIKSRMAASTATWKIVIIHHSPFSSSSNHGSITRVQWPFQSWGADFVLSGHDHDYERILMPDGFPYIVNGIGGAGIYGFGTPVTGSAVRYSTQHGAQLIDINATTAVLSFFAATSPPTLIDCYTINKPAGGGSATYSTCDGGSPPPSPPPAGTSYSLLTGAAASNTAGTHSVMPWRFTSAATQLAAGWETEAFDASAWPVGRTRFGYGPDLPWNTSLPAASTGMLHHYFRSSFCLSAARRTWLNSLSLSLKVMADNGADVYLNGVKLVADSASNHDVIYWNNVATVLGSSANIKPGVNWLAAYVSNTAGSSDAGFDLDLQFDAAGANPEVPDAPLSPAAPGITASSVTLSWSKPVCDGSSFVASYAIASSPAVSVPAVAVTNPWQASYTSTISGLAPCTTYTFTIAAVNAAGASSPATVTAKTSGCVAVGTYSLLTADLASNTAATRPNIFWRYTSVASKQTTVWYSSTFNASAWPVGRSRFGYGPDLPWNTSLPSAVTTKLYHHYFRSSFCLSAARRTWLNSLSLRLKVMADNGADVYLNGVKLVADSASNHDVLYWNNVATVLGSSANIKQGVNWLAAYVSNTAGSSDAGFDLDLQFDAAGANPEVPDAPLSPAAPGITASSVTLSWSKPVCDGSSFVSSYAIASSPAVSVPAVAVTNPWQASYSSTISGLAPCTTYTFTIAAVNAAGASSPATVTARTSGCRRRRRAAIDRGL